MAPELLIKTLQGLSNDTVKDMIQDDSLATHAPKLTKDQGMIDWHKTAKQLCGLIRGLDPWPGAFTYYNGEMMKLFECSVVSGEIKTTPTPGRINGLTRAGLEVETGDGLLNIKEVQVPGKKRMTAGEFLKGKQLPTGSMLGNKP